MSDLSNFLRLPIVFEKEVKIYPPTVGEVVGTKGFFQYQKILTLSQEEIEDLFVDKTDEKGNPMDIPTPLYFLLDNSYYNKEFEQIAINAFKFFTKTTPLFLYNKGTILLGDVEQLVLELKDEEIANSLEEKMVVLSNDNFLDFQNLIREVIGLDKVEPPDPNEDPRIKRMKAKARLRDKIKAQKGIGMTLMDTLVSICCMGIGLTPLNIGEISYASVGLLIRRYQEKEKYDIDIKSLLAGADSKKIKPKYWIRKLED